MKGGGGVPKPDIIVNKLSVNAEKYLKHRSKNIAVRARLYLPVAAIPGYGGTRPP